MSEEELIKEIPFVDYEYVRWHVYFARVIAHIICILDWDCRIAYTCFTNDFDDPARPMFIGIISKKKGGYYRPLLYMRRDLYEIRKMIHHLDV